MQRKSGGWDPLSSFVRNVLQVSETRSPVLVSMRYASANITVLLRQEDSDQDDW